ncbi:MAG: calcium-transporting P-type ATPase, PMR1-type [Candidatus Aminicenantales bacterium]
MKNWWHLDIQEVARQLATDLSSGLSSQEVQARLAKYGPNQLLEKKGRSPLSIFLEQFGNFIIWVLIGAAMVSGFLREWVDALAIIAIVILNAILGFIQEHRAEKSLLALRKLSAPSSRVIRENQRQVIPSSGLVPGDLIELEAGDHIPADARVVWHTPNFAVLEASLTGESTPVMKTTLVLEEREVPLAERANILYLGTAVVSGKARGVIVETGMETELGRIAGMIQSIERETTPLQRRLEHFGRWIIYLCFGIVGIVFLLEILRGGKLIDMFLTSVSLAVAAIPEGLPAVVTIALALGVQRMVKRHVLIRKLPAVEALGCATVICSDKTGTLTKNEMTVRVVYTHSGLFHVTGTGYDPKGEIVFQDNPVKTQDFPDLMHCLTCGILCNSAELKLEGDKYKIIGDPTEGAILTCAAKTGLWKETLESRFSFIEEIPFDSERKKMTVVRREISSGRYFAYVKGAPDVLLEDCAAVEEHGRRRALDKSDREKILKVNNELSNQALRVLALAYRVFEKEPDLYDARNIEKDLTFLGMMAMIDPPREEVKDAVEKCRNSGIDTVMITGDHKNTAIAIARELGFFKEGALALTGEELDGLSEEEFQRNVRRISVYARVSPEHKLRAVRAWRQQSDVVAMTGDGVNDAPAVKEADIGVAMGITGTDVTKEVSEMVITDDNFASIVAAVEEGRGIYDNIKKFIHYLLSCNTGEILVMFVASLLGLPVPLLPIQILWVNLVTDGLPALALGMDPVDPDIMKRPPRPPKEPIITRARAKLILAQGAFIAFCSLLAFCFVLFVENEGIARARTAALIALTCSQLFHSLNCRSQSESLFKIGLLSNVRLVYAATASFFLQLAIIFIPFTQRIFKVEALSILDLAVLTVISSLPFWAMELLKAVNKNKKILTAA